MLFSLAVLSLAVGHAWWGLTTCSPQAVPFRRRHRAIALLFALAIACGIAPGSWQAVPAGIDLVAWLLLLAAGAGVTVAALRIERLTRPGVVAGPHREAKTLLVAMCVAVYVCISVLDHLLYFVVSGQVVLLRPDAGLRTGCPQLVLARELPEGMVEYRCALDHVWNVGSSQPLVPWPSYRRTRSAARLAGHATP